MTIKQLKEELNRFPEEANVLVTYTVKPSCCQCGDYCYCQYEDYEVDIQYITSREIITRKNPHPKIETVLINT